MFPSFLITFRETLEVSLVVGIVLSYLLRTRQTQYNNVVYVGVAAGIVASIIGALIFQFVAGGFTGRGEEIFEGVTMLIGAFLLTSMILWMLRQRNIAAKLEARVQKQVDQTTRYGLFALVLVAVLREGIETVIFLSSATIVSGGSVVVGSLAGVVVAIGLGYLIFVSSKKVNIKKFFTATSILLILFAAGLIAHGVHELQEASLIPTMVEHVWDTNAILHEQGTIGSLFKGLFGYNGNPSLLEVASYGIYLATIAVLWRRVTQKKHLAVG